MSRPPTPHTHTHIHCLKEPTFGLTTFSFLALLVVCSDVNAAIIARGTVGFTGAELENLVNQAALKAAVDGLDLVTMKELEFSKDKILMGG